MRVQHNIMAMNSYRNYNNNVSSLSANLEKLSSGYRINRAGDDAAGLAISEKMRAQITGLDAAQKNVKDGISLVKTAEGALQEVQDMMNRMVYLAEQSANGTYDNDVDRKALQEEVDALSAEIDRIAKSANFNGQKLLDGSLQDGAPITAEQNIVGTVAGQEYTSATQLDGAAFQDGDNVTIAGVQFTYAAGADGTDGETFSDYATLQAAFTEATGLNLAEEAVTEGATEDQVSTVNATMTDPANPGVGDTITIGGTTYTIAAKEDTAANEYTSLDDIAEAAGVTLDNQVVTTKNAAGQVVELGTTDPTALANGNTVTVDGATYTYDGADWKDGEGNTATIDISVATTEVTYDATVAGDAGTTTYKYTSSGVGESLILQIGDTSDDYNKLAVSVDSMMTADLFGGAIDISEQDLAQDAIDTIKTAINTVSAQRGRLGAVQNRLEHTMNNLSVMEENIQDAESTIRDTDVADEMMAYTKNNILIQTSQAMLAQANMVPQGVLQLLQ